jgi:ribulose-5-phosphate 4-epimerase/fuculose-1-phosphate aldolase
MKSEFGEDEQSLRVQLAAAYRIAHHLGWTRLIYHHISARVPGPNRHYLINQYGLLAEETKASNLIKVDAFANAVDGSKERINRAAFVIHGAIHQAREDAQCVWHMHTTVGTALSCLAEGLLPISQEAMIIHSQIAYHDYEGLAVDEGERARILEHLGNKNVLILRNHGLLTIGRTVAEAYLRMHILESAAATQLMIQSSGQRNVAPSPDLIPLVAKQFDVFNREGFGELEFAALLRRLDRIDASYRT